MQSVFINLNFGKISKIIYATNYTGQSVHRKNKHKKIKHFLSEDLAAYIKSWCDYVVKITFLSKSNIWNVGPFFFLQSRGEHE